MTWHAAFDMDAVPISTAKRSFVTQHGLSVPADRCCSLSQLNNDRPRPADVPDALCSEGQVHSRAHWSTVYLPYCTYLTVPSIAAPLGGRAPALVLALDFGLGLE
jgi:hypothetical protein